jgi:signal transduction histidine kinase
LEEKAKKDSNPLQEVKFLSKELAVLRNDLRSIAPMLVRSTGDNVEDTIERLNSVVLQIQEAQPSLAELQNQSAHYRGLATIGIAATVFGHETQSAIAGFVGSTDTAISLLEASPPRINEAREELQVAVEFANKVSGWGAFALARIQRDKRRRSKVNIENLVREVIGELLPTLGAVNIDVQIRTKPVAGRIFAMDVEAVLINLLTNAYAACQQVRRKRIIRVGVAPKNQNNVNGVEIVVADSGPGVAKQFKDRIWDPLFTTRTDDRGRPVGTGLGLAIVRSILEDSQGKSNLDSDPELKGARFTIWFPLN